MQSVMQHSFSRAPTADIQRSSFNRSHGHKTTFDADLLIPIFLDEALPGDTFNMNCSAFCRLATPLHPLMDNMFMDIHFFSTPVRQLWTNARKFFGERYNPDDSIDFTIPTIEFADNVVTINSVADYFGIPLGYDVNEVVSALFFRNYDHVYNEWYRDQNLINSVAIVLGDGPDSNGDVVLRRRGKRHDYFTSCLPWPQKGDAVQLPLGTSANVINNPNTTTGGQHVMTADGANTNDGLFRVQGTTDDHLVSEGASYTGYARLSALANTMGDDQSVWIADLSTATAATVNQLREAFQIQKLLERDARSGTRYAEIVKAHFGVDFFDVTYRPEYLGGTSVPVNIHPVPQTSETATTPQGNLAAFGTVGISGGGFTKSFTEHCIIMGIASVRADLTYQQGINRMFTRSTRYDFFWPALANLGEQEVLSREIYADGTAGDTEVFGYQERWAEYRYKPSIITGLFRSNAAAPLDSWHLSQDFTARPELNQAFIESNTPLDRVIEVPSEPHFIGDFFFNLQCARPMPVFSVPGLIDHF